MRRNAYFCDLCAMEEVVKLAMGTYQGDRKGYEACRKHLNEAKRYDLEIIREFDFPGNLDSWDFRG